MNESELRSQTYWQQVPHRELPNYASDQKTAAEIAFLERFLHRSDRVLDLGCGWGRISRALAARGYRVDGLDLSQNLVAFGRKQAPREGRSVHFCVGSLLSLPYPAQAFDKIVCLWGVFNHLLAPADQARAIREIHRSLRPGGEALIEMGNGESRKYRRIRERLGCGPEKRIWKAQFKPGPPPNVLFLHDRASMSRLAADSPFARFRVVFQNIHHKRRIVTYLYRGSRE